MPGIEISLRLLLAFVVPLVLGIFVARYCIGKGRPISTYVAHGYTLGVAAQLAVIKLFDALSIEFSFWPMLILLLVLLSSFVVLTYFDNTTAPTATCRLRLASMTSLPTWQIVVITLMLIICVVNLIFALHEVLIKPTFAWDAWRGWEPKTLQFYYNRSLDAPMETIGNHGSVSTNAQLWIMLAINDPDSLLSHLPWWLAYLSTGLALFGFGKERYGLITGWMLITAFLSMPYVVTHAALAGYADLWLCLIFTLGVLTIVENNSMHSFKTVSLVIGYSVLCIITKRAGFGYGLSLLAVLLLPHYRRFPVTLSLLGLVACTIAAAVTAALAGAFSLKVPVGPFGLLEVNELFAQHPLFGRYHVNPRWVLEPYITAVFRFTSWNIAGVLLPLLFLALLKISSLDTYTRQLLTLLGLTIAYIVIYFGVLAPDSAMNQTALSRAILPIVPLLLATASSCYSGCLLGRETITPTNRSTPSS